MTVLHGNSLRSGWWLRGIILVMGASSGCGVGGYSAEEAHEWYKPDTPAVTPPACENGSTRECYDGNAASLGVGQCQAGTETCGDGAFGPCLGQVAAERESCDGVDNDCDGSVDEGCHCSEGEMRSCYSAKASTRGVGECRDGEQRCQDGVWRVCENQALPSEETCDGTDNDCDGLSDEGNPEGGDACDTRLLGSCGSGVETCQEGNLVCLPVLASAEEICDGEDNDCDGDIDEGNPGGGGGCETGLLGICAFGTRTCVRGSLHCTQHDLASREICDGEDNDCDGDVDEGNPEGADFCDTGLEGVCAEGTLLCHDGSLECVQETEASEELCNELDDDCDGPVDEGCCTHSVCEGGNALSVECGSCAAAVCDLDPFCCDFEWDNLCIGRVRDACDNPGCIAPGSCGHALCVEGSALQPNCDPGECVKSICAQSDVCCSTGWNAECVGQVESLCALDCTFE